MSTLGQPIPTKLEIISGGFGDFPNGTILRGPLLVSIGLPSYNKEPIRGSSAGRGTEKVTYGMSTYSDTSVVLHASLTPLIVPMLVVGLEAVLPGAGATPGTVINTTYDITMKTYNPQEPTVDSAYGARHITCVGETVACTKTAPGLLHIWDNSGDELVDNINGMNQLLIVE